MTCSVESTSITFTSVSGAAAEIKTKNLVARDQNLTGGQVLFRYDKNLVGGECVFLSGPSELLKFDDVRNIKPQVNLVVTNGATMDAQATISIEPGQNVTTISKDTRVDANTDGTGGGNAVIEFFTIVSGNEVRSLTISDSEVLLTGDTVRFEGVLDISGGRLVLPIMTTSPTGPIGGTGALTLAKVGGNRRLYVKTGATAWKYLTLS